MGAEKRVLIVSQAIPQWYVDVLTTALGEGVHTDIITGSAVQGSVINSPQHNAASLKTRLVSWYKHFRFVNRWIKRNKNAHYDLIFAVSNPPINSYLGLKLKKRFNAPFIYMNWDLYPQIIESTLKNPFVGGICKLWHMWNNRNYFKIDQMLTIGEHMAMSINSCLKNKIKVQVIPIAVDTSILRPIEKQKNLFSQQNELCDKFIVLYSGKMGMGHNIELVLEAAEILRCYRDICFVFIGNGSKYSVVKQYIEKKRPENVKLFPLQSEDVFPYSMACGDIGVVTQEAQMAHLFMPSKAYSMMACGEAIIGICTGQDDLFSLLKNYSIGAAVTDETAETLAKEIYRLYENSAVLTVCKKNARMTAETKYDSKVILLQYRELFKRFLALGQLS